VSELKRSTEIVSKLAMMGQTPAILPHLASKVKPSVLVLLYIALTILFTVPWTLLLLHTHHLDIGRGFVIHTQMWAPALAAFACCAIYRIPLSFLGFHWPGGRAMAWGYLLPVAYATTAYFLVWFTGLAPADFASFAHASQISLQIRAGAGELNAILIMTFGVLQSAVSATGERDWLAGISCASFSATPQLYWRGFGQWCHLGTVALPSYPLRHVQQRGAKVGGSPVLHDHDSRHRCHGGMATPKERLRVACGLASCLPQRRHPMVVRFDDGGNRESSVVRRGIWGCIGCDFDFVCNTNLAKWCWHTRSYS
jgi:hypothetical protein